MRTFSILSACLCLLASGCGPAEVADDAAPARSAGDSVDPQYLAKSKPAESVPVGEAREGLENGDKATLVGIIGGSREPFVDGLAAFTIVDPKVPYCAPDEGCPTPWDYCCTQDQVKDNIATVKIVSASGAPVMKDARELLGVDALSKVLVSGTATRDEQGNLTLAADRVFVSE